MRTDVLALPTPAPTGLTVERWGALPEEERGELVHGQLVEEEVPDLTHESVVMWITERLLLWAAGRGARLFGSGAKYAVAPDRGRLPDLSLFLAGRVPPGRGVVRMPPDLAVEVVSTSLADVRRDRVEKLGEYAAFGIRWYWVVDPQLRSFEVWELRDGTYARAGAALSGVVDGIPGFLDLLLDLDDLWSRIDALGPEDPP